MKNWTTVNIPQRDKGLALITGSTEGVGFEDALALSSAGWNVIMMGRNAEKGSESIVKIHKINPKAKVSFEKIDLAYLSSIKDFDSRFK